jgi:hypothetical protein
MRQEEASDPDKFKVERRGRFADVEDAYLSADMVNRMYLGVPNGYDESGGLELLPINSNWGSEIRVMNNYVGHFDPSSTTAGFGFAMGHIERFMHKDAVERDHVVFDIIKRWKPQDFDGGAIDWEIVLEELINYMEMFRPSMISYDMFQTDAPSQWLQRQVQARGLDTNLHLEFPTNEKNWKRAETFKTALYQGLVHAPNDTIDTEWSKLELRFLVKKTTGAKFPRVDKQDLGPVQTKDMADCIMEVTNRLIGNTVARSVREQLSANSVALGAKHGYQIGGALNGVKDAPELAHFYGGKRIGEQSFGAPSRPRVKSAVSSRMRGISRRGR